MRSALFCSVILAHQPCGHVAVKGLDAVQDIKADAVGLVLDVVIIYDSDSKTVPARCNSRIIRAHRQLKLTGDECKAVAVEREGVGRFDEIHLDCRVRGNSAVDRLIYRDLGDCAACGSCIGGKSVKIAVEDKAVALFKGAGRRSDIRECDLGLAGGAGDFLQRSQCPQLSRGYRGHSGTYRCQDHK